MSEQSASEFLAKLKADPDLRGALAESVGAAAMDHALSFASENGHEFSHDELMAAYAADMKASGYSDKDIEDLKKVNLQRREEATPAKTKLSFDPDSYHSPNKAAPSVAAIIPVSEKKPSAAKRPRDYGQQPAAQVPKLSASPFTRNGIAVFLPEKTDQYVALKKFKTGSEVVNKALRASDTSDASINKQVKLIDEALVKLSAGHLYQQACYRGVNVEKDSTLFKELTNVGGEFTDKGFFCTSKLHYNNWEANDLKQWVACNFRIVILGSKTGVYIQSTFPKNHPEEEEVLFPRGSKFRILKVEEGVKTVVTMEQLS